ncbi:MAG TPA: T9SS type A sorting domain-containing protein [Chitinophagaceae bacterium]|nr:T9SS type A sorting domain-containing protein [Chitinophagaceae bacterium]
MKSLLLFVLSICLVFPSMAQATKTVGQSGPVKEINFSDPKIKDFDIHLIQLDQHPIPSAEYGNKKEELNKLRALKKNQTKPLELQKKTRGAATNPFIFKGAQGNTSNSIPNDNDIAVSNDGKVVSVVNSNMRIYDDTLKAIFNKTLTSLVSSIGVYSWISDPRIIYDPASDRFSLVCFSGNLSYESTIIVGFTQTNDPTGVWNFYTLNGNSFNDSTWSDYPIISISDKDLFITFNQVKDNVSWTVGFKQSVIWQIDKQTGYSGVPLQYTLWSDIKYNGTPLRNICPAKNQSSVMDNKMYFLTLRNVDASNDSIFLTEINDSHISGNAQISQRVLKSPTPYGFPPNAVQKYYTGAQQYLMTNDARVLAAIYENDYIHFGSNTVNPTYMNAGVYLGTIKNVSSTTPIVTADILSNDTIEYGYPSMTYMGNYPAEHKILYTFSHCYVDSFPGTSVVYKDMMGNYSDIIPTKNGTSNINVLTDSVERWGDYTNIQRKYNNNERAYLSGSWGKSSGVNCWVTIVDNKDFSVSTNDIKNEFSNSVYPNPMQDHFSVQFELAKANKVRFEILDMNGRIVSLLLDTYTQTGKNEFSFLTSPLVSGHYILQISTKEEVLSSQKILVK